MRFFPVVYILVMFFAVPALLLGLSACFEQDSKGFTVLGAFLCVILGLGILYTIYWWRYKDGKEKCYACIAQRQRRSDASKALPDDMEFLKAEVARLKDHTGLPDEDENDEVEGKDVEDGGKQLESDDTDGVEEEA